ncbi:MAG: hypothetical protein WBI82_15500 [Sphaerochaeta sp.]
MKMKLTFLLLASVFFVSCGMPTIFNPSLSEYTFSKTSPDPVTTFVQGKLSMHLDPSGPNYDLLEGTDTKGPSLMFFYTFDNPNDIAYTLSSNEISDIILKFASEYIKNAYDGIPVVPSNEILSVKFTDTISNLEKNVYLYGMSTQGASTQFTARDQYVLFEKNQRNGASLDPFTLTKVDIGSPATGCILNLTYTDITSSSTFISNAPSGDLYAFDGQPFSLIKENIQNKIKDANNHEYDYLGEQESVGGNAPESVRLHLFAAFFISGNFSNNFWSKLIHLGAIPIDLQ